MSVAQHRYPNLHIGYARSLRRTMTDPEHKLWGVLKQRSISNLKWRRQQPIGPYIVDFYCPAKKLIIEVDGGQHCASREDLARDKWLKQRSFSVLRFWNNEILNDLDAVFAAIVQRQSLIELPPSASQSLGSSPSRRKKRAWGEPTGSQAQPFTRKVSEWKQNHPK